jgi:SH3-like domain-containing protein
VKTIVERKFAEMKRVLWVSLFLLLGLPISFAAEEAKPAPAAGPNKKVLVKSEEDAGLYSKADTKSARLDMIEQFTPVEVISSEKEWTQVKTGEDKTGYIQTKNLSDTCFVSTRIAGGKKVNLRMGPEKDSPVSVELLSDYPLWVLEVKKVDKDVRIHVVDYEGDGGWAHKSYLSFDRYVVATPTEEVAWIAVREGAGTDKNGKPLFPRRFQAERGTAFKVLEDKEGWLHIKHADGDEGWCSAKMVWGWNQPENPGKKVEKPAAKPADSEEKAKSEKKSGESEKKASTEKKPEAAKKGESTKKAEAPASTKKGTSSAKKGTSSSKKASSSK